MFNQKSYIASEAWRGNDYLVQPDTGAKRCQCCDKLFYSVEFPAFNEATDGLLLVCLSCFRSKTKKDAVENLILAWGVERACRKCGQVFPAIEFRTYSKAKNAIDNVCQECSPPKPSYWTKKDDEDDFDFENENEN